MITISNGETAIDGVAAVPALPALRSLVRVPLTIVSLICILILCASPSRTLAQSKHQTRAPHQAPTHAIQLHGTVQITVLLIPGLRADDITEDRLPALCSLIREGQSGWMVCRAARPSDPDQLRPDGREPTDALVLSLGSGARARVGPEADGLVSPTPHALHVLPYPPPGSLEALKKANSALGYTVPIGALGSMLHAVGMRTAVFGNMDSDRPDRSVYLFAMDGNGLVDDAASRLSKILSADCSPFGIASHNAKILDGYDKASDTDSTRVIACGELYRADRYEPLSLPAIAAQHRTAALASVNRMCEEISSRVRTGNTTKGRRERLVVLSPAPADSTISSQDRLAPIVLWGFEIEPGTITSASTRRQGLVVNADLLATVAHWLQQPLPAGATGRAITSTAYTRDYDATQVLNREYIELVGVSDLQNALGGLPTVQLLLVLIGVLGVYLQPLRWSSRLSAVAMVSLPLAMLLPAIWIHTGVISGALCLVSLTLVSIIVSVKAGSSRTAKAVSGMLIGAILLDLLTGSHVLQHAWMSYSATDGSRFYGIGNEYMGAAIGALCLLYPAFTRASNQTSDLKPMSKSARFGGHGAYFALASTTLIVMVLPFAGAKVGALPSEGVPLVVMLLLSRNRRIVPRNLVVAVVGLAAVFALMVAIDSHGGQSHLIRTLTGSGGDPLQTVILRKWRMEAHLLVHSPWTATMLTAACALAALRPRLRSTSQERNRMSNTVLWGVVSGAIACLICNDAGVLAATLVLLYGCAWALIEVTEGLPIVSAATTN